MERKKRKKVKIPTINIYDLVTLGDSGRVAKVVRHYRRTGGFSRTDLRRVLGDPSAGFSAGRKGLEELLAKQRPVD